MPLREKKISLRFWGIIAAAIVLAIVAVCVILNLRKDTSSPSAIIKSSGIEAASIKKVIVYKGIAVSVGAKAGENPNIYLCRNENGKWSLDKTIKVKPDSSAQPTYMFPADTGNKNAICIIFASKKNTDNMKLVGSDKSTKNPMDSGSVSGYKFYAFSFDDASKNNNMYSVSEIWNNIPLKTNGLVYSEGTFDIVRNGTNYHYKAGDVSEIAAEFKGRLNSSSVNFTDCTTALNSNTFLITYNSATHVYVKPGNSKSPVIYDKVTIKMPLEGNQSNMIFVSGNSHAVITERSAEKLNSLVLKQISGK